MSDLASPIATVVVGFLAAYVARLNARDPFSRLRAALELREKMPEECLVVWDEYLHRQVVRASLDRSSTRNGLVVAALGFPLVLLGSVTGQWAQWILWLGWVLYAGGLVYWGLALHVREDKQASSHAAIRDLRTMRQAAGDYESEVTRAEGTPRARN
jgi:hypothetical protein